MEKGKIKMQKEGNLKRNYLGSLSTVLFCFGLASCMVGPKYQAPKNDLSNQWPKKAVENDNLYSTNAVKQKWWENFEDSLLNRFVDLAAKNNQDILAAEKNVLQARALRQVAASTLFPQINGDLNANRTEFSRNGRFLAYSLPGVPIVQNLYNALFDASWELDLFGKTRHGVEAATARVGSAIERRNDLLISVMAEVAKNYMEIRSYQRKAVLLTENIRLLEDSVLVIQQSVKDGYKNQLNLEDILAQLSFAKSQLPESTAKIYRGIYALSVLTGQMPEALLDELIKPEALPKMPYEVAIGVRSDLLRRRPDVRIAERALAAATAEIGVAVASFFPTFSLSADLGLQAVKIANLFRAASKTWELGGDMNAPIFQGGRLMGNWKASKAQEASLMYSYQKTVLNALQEAESALVSYREDLKNLKNLKDKSERNRNLVRLTETRHVKGLVDIINLINAQRDLVSTEEQVLTSNTTALLDLIILYKALGGGWEGYKLSDL